MTTNLLSIPRSLLVLLALYFVGGCGSAPDGPPRFQISGSVTFDGKPVPKGFITFEPDGSKGNKGPGGGAAIANGRFKTEAGKGVVGGPHVVRIVGYDGVAATMEGEQLADGKPLFATYVSTVDFPKENGTRDFAVPKPESQE